MGSDAYEVVIEGERAQVATAAELVVVLDVLHGHHDRQVLEQLGPDLPEIIGTAKELHAVFTALTAQDQQYLIRALGPLLAQVVQDARGLRDLLVTLADTEVEECLVRSLGGDGLRRLIGSAEELAEVLEWVYGSADGAVLSLLGAPALKGLIRSGQELAQVMRSLDFARQAQLLDAIGWEAVPALVQDELDLAHLLRALPEGHSARLIGCFAPVDLSRKVGGPPGLARIARYLEPAEARCLGEILGVTENAQ